MSDSFRINAIRTIIDEIALLTGGGFEQFGYRVMEVIRTANWVERGTTVEGAPRGYTVDDSAEGASLVAEMSSESDYFHGDLIKPQRDLKHAIDLHPDSTHIWLLSSREAEAGETTKCANLVTRFKTDHGLAHVEILDSRMIAKYIFDNLESERFVETLTSYLPSLGRLVDENAFSHRVPKYPGYQSRSDLESAVIAKIADVSCTVVVGISGIGKSALVAQVAERLRPDYDAIIWYDAHDLNNVAQLYDIDIRRAGTRHNIASFLHRHKCLLVLDDSGLSSRDFVAVDCGQSKVIITCQSTSDPQSIIVGDLDEGSSRKLMQAGISEPCPENVFTKVFSNVGGFPLLLSALNTVAQEEGWQAVEACCEDMVSAIEDERHDKVCQRILNRHREALASELQFVKWCGQSRFAPDLAYICVSKLAVKNLQKSAFLSATGFGYIRIHDVVYKSICVVINVSAYYESEFNDKLDKFLHTECNNEKSSLRRIVHFHSNLLKRLLALNPRPSFVYAVALARSADTPIQLFGDPVTTAKELVTYDTWSGRGLEIRAVIESVEAIYTITVANQGKDAAKALLEKNNEAVGILYASPLAGDEWSIDLRHHYAKMLVRLDKLSEAESEFRAMLDEHPMLAACRLQLCRILQKTQRKQEALDECKKILDQHNALQMQVPSTVLIEALRLIATVGTSDDLRSYENIIMTTLMAVREFDIALAIRLVASVAQKTWYTMPQLVIHMFELIEWGDAVPATDSERFNWAQAHKAAAKVTAVTSPRRREFLIIADDTYKSIRTPNSYHLVHHAEALILLEKFDEANVLLEHVPEPRDAFWWQRKAQALLGLSMGDTALAAINEALLKLKDDKYRAAFLNDRYRIRMLLKDEGAVEDLREAVDILPENDKYRKELESKLTAELDANQ